MLLLVGVSGQGELNGFKFDAPAKPRFLDNGVQSNAFFRLDVDNQLVRRMVLVVSKERKGVLFEFYNDFRVAPGQTFASAQIDGHVNPAPVVYARAERYKSFGVGRLGEAALFEKTAVQLTQLLVEKIVGLVDQADDPDHAV